MGSGPECRFLGYSRTYPGHIQRNSEHSISSFRQSLRVDALQRDLPENHPSVLSSSSGPVCKPNQQSTSSVCVSVPRPRSNGNGCIPLQLESVEKLDFSAGSLDPKDSEQAQSRRSYSSHPSPPLEGTAMVPYNTGNVSGLPKTTPSTAETNQSPLRPRERTPPPAHTTPNCVALSGKVSAQKDFRKQLQTYCFHHEVKPPKNATQDHGELGLAGVLNGASVPLLQL